MSKRFNGERYLQFVTAVAGRVGIYGEAVKLYGAEAIKYHESNLFDKKFIKIHAVYIRSGLTNIGWAGEIEGINNVRTILEALDIAEDQSLVEIPSLFSRAKKVFTKKR